jgi:hypothetical protein
MKQHARIRRTAPDVALEVAIVVEVEQGEAPGPRPTLQEIWVSLERQAATTGSVQPGCAASYHQIVARAGWRPLASEARFVRELEPEGS